MASSRKTTLRERQPIIFIILDGWGIAAPSSGNAITQAKTPTVDMLMKRYPTTLLDASGEAVGLPTEQAGNSEAGHMNIGAGRVVLQDLMAINNQIKKGLFFKNPALIESLHYLERTPKARVHIVGLLAGEQSSHTYPLHLYSLLQFYNQHKVTPVYLHLFSDGRDSGMYDGVKMMEKLLRICRNGETVSTLVGRFYGMDRGRNWERTKKAYELITEGTADVVVNDPFDAFTRNYELGASDEFIVPTRIDNKKKPPAFIQSGDVVVFYNCRSERARQLVKPFVEKDFEKVEKNAFVRKKKLKDLFTVTFTDFAEELDHAHVAFPSEVLENTLPCGLAEHGYRQLYIAESEKYAHMTYFLNGGVAKTRCGEKRLRFRSSRKKSFALKPEMETAKIAQAMVKHLRSGEYDFIAANFANPDMVGHTGDIKATIKGVEVVDKALKKVYDEAVKQNALLVITADHGNAEEMIGPDGPDTQHNFNPVPLIIADTSRRTQTMTLRAKGKLANIVPTLFDYCQLEKPQEMTARSLIIRNGTKRKKH